MWVDDPHSIIAVHEDGCLRQVIIDPTVHNSSKDSASLAAIYSGEKVGASGGLRVGGDPFALDRGINEHANVTTQVRNGASMKQFNVLHYNHHLAPDDSFR